METSARNEFAAEFATKPWAVQFSATQNSTRNFRCPFDGSSCTAEIPAAQGKRCLGLYREWLLMLDDDDDDDEATNECFLLHLTTQLKVALPPLLEPPPPGDSSSFTLSSPTAAPPDCIAVLSVYDDEWLLYCSPGDEEWSRLSVFEGLEDDDEVLSSIDALGAAVVAGRDGEVYATTLASLVFEVDATSTPLRIEKKYTKLSTTCPLHCRTNGYLVESLGDIFCVRLYLHLHGPRPRARVVNADVHVKERCSDDAWERVETIGDRAILIGRNNSCVVSCAADAGLEPNCIYVLALPQSGGIPLYTVFLDDMTIRCNLLRGFAGDGEKEAYWAVPACFEEALVKDVAGGNVLSRQANDELDEHGEDQEGSIVSSPSSWSWSCLPGDLLELIADEVPFVDLLRLRAVCKDWSGLIPRHIQCAKSPLLLTAHARTDGLLATFNPMTGKKYELGYCISSDEPEPRAHRCSRHGWVLGTEGDDEVFLLNPTKGHIVHLPPMNGHFFSGISFTSVPGSPDFMVVGVRECQGIGTTRVKTWRQGDEDWTVKDFDHDPPFPLSSHNPLLFDGEWYCLARTGRLGVLNPSNMTWSVLAKPEPLYDETDIDRNESCYLLEWKGQLIAIFTGLVEGPMRIFRLDRSRMAWSELEEGLADAVLFMDRGDAFARPAEWRDLGNWIYLPRFIEADGVATLAVCYSIEKRQYCPAFYGYIEPVNAIWFEPNM